MTHVEYPRLFNEEKKSRQNNRIKVNRKQKQISMTSFKHEQKNDDEVNFAGGLCLRYVKKLCLCISILNRLEAKLYIPSTINI